jgi:hypothetical protein
VTADAVGPGDRRPAIAVAGIKSLRFMPDGAEASLLNISPTGLLAESGTRQRVGAGVEVVFQGGFEPSTVTGRVARCEVALMGRDGSLKYHIAMEFDALLELDGEARRRASAPAQREVRNRW